MSFGHGHSQSGSSRPGLRAFYDTMPQNWPGIEAVCTKTLYHYSMHLAYEANYALNTVILREPQ